MFRRFQPCALSFLNACFLLFHIKYVLYVFPSLCFYSVRLGTKLIIKLNLWKKWSGRTICQWHCEHKLGFIAVVLPCEDAIMTDFGAFFWCVSIKRLYSAKNMLKNMFLMIKALSLHWNKTKDDLQRDFQVTKIVRKSRREARMI